MLLTDAQLHEIRQIIADHHSAFVANVISPRAVAPDTLERLRSKGLLNVQINSVEDAYLYGQLLAALEDPKVSKMSYEQFKAHLKRNPIPLSPIEQRAVQIAEHSAGQYAKGLGNRIDIQTGQIAIDADTNLQAKMRDTIRTATAESLAKRETARQLASNLGHETKDWARDWDRIAITEMHNAKERGTADVYAKRFGSGVRVAKRTMPDACEHCKRLHDGPDGHPRIFKLSELERNGTNHGRKVPAWKAVVGTVHPHCCPEGTCVLTKRGEIPIEHVVVGDQILSHDSKWHPVLALSRHTSQQEGVELRGDDWRLICTNDHPIYQGGGWVAATKLQEGNHVVRKATGGDFVARHQSKEHEPTSPKEKVQFLRILHGMLSSGVPVTAVDFDGDLFLRKGQIDIVDMRWVLEVGGESSKFQGFKDNQLLLGVRSASLCCGDFEAVFKFAGRTPNGSVCGSGIPLTLFRGELCISTELGLTSRPGVIPCLQKPANHNLPGNSDLMSYRVDREEIVEVQLLHELGSDIQPAGIRRRFVHSSYMRSLGFSGKTAHAEGGPISARASEAQSRQSAGNSMDADMKLARHFRGELQVVEHGLQSDIINFDCHCSPIVARQNVKLQGVTVYNLAVEGAESYFANGILVHNCQCTMVRIPEGWGFDEHDELVPGGAGGIAYNSHEDMERAMREELDLEKSVAMGHVNFQGLPIEIENAPGTVRHWKTPDGEAGETEMLFGYGEISGTMGDDGDPIDVYVGPDPRAKMVYIVHQQNPHTGIYDEAKIMVGFAHEQAARAAYQAHYNRPDFLGTISPMAIDHFKRWAFGTKAGDLLARGEQPPRLVIPLQKSNVPSPGLESTGNVSPEMVETRADARAPGPGVGANYLFNTPKRTRTPTLRESGFDPSPRELFDNLAHRHKAGKKDRADYEFQEPLPAGTFTHPMELPENWPAIVTEADAPDIEARKKQMVKEGLKNTAAVKNHVELSDNETP